MTVGAQFPGAEARLGALAAVLLLAAPTQVSAQQSKAASPGSTPLSNQSQFLDRYCVGCHNERLRTGGMSLVPAESAKPGAQPELWEKVVRKLRSGVMPPPTAAQPPESDRLAMFTWLEISLDAASVAKPNPGRTETLRRLNRTEYQNSIRDLLGLDIDAGRYCLPMRAATALTTSPLETSRRRCWSCGASGRLAFRSMTTGGRRKPAES